MKVLIDLNHPAHYHLFKNTMKMLKTNGIKCVLVAQTKDILTDLLDEEGIKYINIKEKRRKKNSLLVLMIDMLLKDFRMLRIALKEKPDIMIGTSISICHIGKLINKPTYIFGEDDAHLVPLVANLAFPFVKGIISPIVCSLGKWEKKKIGYNGYQKLAYLHPNYFKPDIDIVKKYIDTNKRYCIIRLAKLNAHHDKGISGFSEKHLKKIIDKLSNWCSVYISSEEELSIDLQKYKLSIEYKDMHDVLFFASLYIGDSQSMAVEAAMLGTPGLRFNDFAGRISVLEELEKKYGLTFAYKTNDFQSLLNKIDELINTKKLKEIWNQRRELMISEKIDLTAFIEWFVRNFPASESICKKKYHNEIYKFEE